MRDGRVFRSTEAKATFRAVSAALLKYDDSAFIDSPRLFEHVDIRPMFFTDGKSADELLVSLDLNGESITMADLIVFNTINRSVGGTAMRFNCNTLAEEFTIDVFDAYCIGFLLSEHAFETPFELLDDFKKIYRRRKTVFVKLFTGDPDRFMSALYYAKQPKVMAFIESTFMENSARFGGSFDIACQAFLKRRNKIMVLNALLN